VLFIDIFVKLLERHPTTGGKCFLVLKCYSIRIW